METKLTTVARINNVNILILDGPEKRVAIKPICEALGIDYPTQYARLQSDPILASTIGLSPTVGADDKDRKMVTIPFKFVFGWLFRIDSRNVKEEARESVLRYQMACYDALYNSLFNYVNYVEFRANRINSELERLKLARIDFATAKDKVNEAHANLNKAQALTYDDYLADQQQLGIDFGKEEGHE